MNVLKVQSSSSCFLGTKPSNIDVLVLNPSNPIRLNRIWNLCLRLPDSLFWNVLILVTIVLNYVFVTLDLTFSLVYYEKFLYLYVIFDVLYFIDFVISIFHKFLFAKIDSKLLVIVVDFLSIIPQFVVFASFLNSSLSFLVIFCRLSTILRLNRLSLFGKIREKSLQNDWNWFALQYFTIFSLIVHTTVCLWCSLFNKKQFKELLVPTTPQTDNILNYYLSYSYYSLQLFLNVGFGDIFPETFAEVYLISAIIIAGQFLTIWFICYLSWKLIIRKFQNFKIAVQIKTALKCADEATKSKISRYFFSKHCDYFGYNSLLETLPPVLKQDILYDLNCGLLQRSKILKELPESILKRLASQMKSVLLPQGECVYFQYVLKTGLVCIEDGVLEILNHEDQETPLISFRKGTVLGEVALFFNIPSKCTVRVKENAEIRILEKRDFLKIIRLYPEEFEKLHEMLNKRLTWAIRNRKTIQKYRSPSLRRLKLNLSQYLVENVDENRCWDMYKMNLDDNNLPDVNVNWGKLERSIPRILELKLGELKFNLDVFSLFPIEVLSFLFEDTTRQNRFFDLFKFNRLLRLYRLPDVLLVCGKEDLSLMAKLTNILIYSALTVYYSAAFLYLNSCFDIICNDSSWYYAISSETEDFEDPKKALFDSLYFTVTIAFCTGIGDIMPKSTTDYCITATLLVSFLILKSHWLAEIISQMFLNEFFSGSIEANLCKKMCSKIGGSSSNIVHQIYRFLDIDPNFSNVSSRYFLADSLPSFLTIRQHEEKNSWKNIGLFKKIDPYFLALLEKTIKFWTFPKNEIIYYSGDPTRQMFVIERGYCNIYNADNILEKSVGPGHQLGVLEILYSLPKNHTVIAKTDCVLAYLDYSSIDTHLKLFPKELIILETTLFEKDIRESIAQLERSRLVTDLTKEITEKEYCFTNLLRKWPNYYELYRQKLGRLWYVSFLLIPVAVHPQSLFLKSWCLTRACFILLQSIVSMIIVLKHSGLENIVWIAWIGQTTLYLEMYLSLHIVYYNGKGKLNTHTFYTSWNYLTRGFLLDLITALTWQYFLMNYNFDSDRGKFYSNPNVCGLIAQIQFHKVFQCLRYYENRNVEWKNLWKFFELMLIVVLIINVLVFICASYFFQYTVFHKNYTTGLYVVIDWMTHSGFGNFGGNDAKVAAIFTTLIGFILFGIITSSICTIFLVEVEESVNFRHEVFELLKFVSSRKIPAKMKQKIITHFNLIWENTKGSNVEEKLYSEYYYNNRLLSSTHDELFCDVPLLHHYNTNYMKIIVNQLKIRYFQKDEMITSYKDVLSDIYIICTGQVEIFNKNKDPLCLLGRGGVFGNIRKNSHSFCNVYVTARRNVKLWVLSSQSFFNTVKYYPIIAEEVDKMLKGKPAYLPPIATEHNEDSCIRKRLLDELELNDDTDKTTSDASFDTRTQINSWKRFVFKIDRINKILDFVTFISSLSNVLIITYVFVTQEKSSLEYVYVLTEPIFYVRIFFQIRTLWKTYLNTPRLYLWDIIPNLPVTLLCYCFEKEQFFSYTCIRLFHLLRFYYVVEFFRMNMRELFMGSWWYLAKVICYYCILIHIFACSWFMVACPFNKCGPETWMSQFNHKILQKSTARHKMILSYYFVLNLISTTGIGNIVPKFNWEITLTLITTFVGKIFISILTATILKTMYVIKKLRGKFVVQLMSLIKILQNKNISNFLFNKLLIYKERIWVHEQGIVERNILETLSYPLLQELTSFLYEDILKESFLFQDLDQSLLSQISTKLKRVIYFENDYITKTGEVNSTMYFINKGSVFVLTKHSPLKETKHIKLYPRDLFGVSQGLNLEKSHHFCYRAASPVVEILSLQHDDWSYIIDFFPRDKQQLLVRVHKEYNKLK
ncbi:unnamed protein product [Phyllotreta striolata]|uniref:Cyclic nucleotide-binding domain-containing protein n=1 Tax=Phyllotreta striolata TaxID=444603 RepID=A0A9P0GVB5_PHYSR|nr:unnamed protein product [Phyllotreta striolata]